MNDSNEWISVIMTALIFERYQFNITLAALRNLLFFTYPYKIQLIFVHNKWRKCDEMDAHIKALNFDDYIYVANEENLSLGKMYNQGIAHAKYENIAILSNDMLVHEDWYKYGKYALDNGLDIVCLYTHRFKRQVFEDEVASKTKDGLWVYSFSDGAGAFLIKKKAYDLIGPFNEEMRLYMDRDYYYRLRKQGIKMGSHIKSTATHLGQMTLINPENNTKHQDIFGWDYYEQMEKREYGAKEIRAFQTE